MKRILGMLAAFVICGCNAVLEDDYAVATGASVNGVQSFVRLLRSDGHKVRVSRRLYKDFARSVDAVVMFPQAWGSLPDATERHLAKWLRDDEDHVAVIVARDFDQSIAYWRQVLKDPNAFKDADARQFADDALKSAERGLSVRGGDAPAGELGFGLKPSKKGIRHADSAMLKVDYEGLALEPGKLDLYFHRELELPKDARQLLTAGNDTALAEIRTGAGRLYVVPNGSFLLNQGLVNRENRKLALLVSKMLGDDCNISMVLGGELGGKEAEDSQPGVLRFLSMGPMPWMTAQVAALLLLYLVAKSPLFGRPRTFENDAPMDFRSHIDAIAGLLTRTRSREFAHSLWSKYLASQGKSPRVEQPLAAVAVAETKLISDEKGKAENVRPE